MTPADGTCIGCFRPDTRLGLVVVGDVHAHAGALQYYAQLPEDEASATASFVFRDAGVKETERLRSMCRLCETCAAKTSAPVYSIAAVQAGVVNPTAIFQAPRG